MNDRKLTAYDLVDRYNRAYFDDLSARYRTRNRFARQRMANVLSLLPELGGKRLLDLGCGMGTFTIEGARRGALAIGVDLVPAALEAATRVASEELVGAARFVQADAAELPFTAASIDLIIAADLTEHLDDGTLDRVLAEARRVLDPAGWIVLYTPEATHIFERLGERGIMWTDPSHIGLRTATQLAAVLARSGFEVTCIRYLPSHLPVLRVAERILAPWVPLLRRRAGLIARKRAS